MFLSFYGSPDKRVARGVALLEREYDFGFESRLDPDALCLTSPRWCVLGQLYGDYYRAKRLLGLRRPKKYGFLSRSPDDRRALEAAWRRALVPKVSRRVPADPAPARELERV